MDIQHKYRCPICKKYDIYHQSEIREGIFMIKIKCHLCKNIVEIGYSEESSCIIS